MEIKEVNWGIANRFSTHIEINKHLKEYPHLLNPILKHENSHTNKFFSKHDFKLDFLNNSDVNSFEMLKFMIRHPKSFTQLLPFYWTKKSGFVYDVNMIIMYAVMSPIFIGTLYFGGRYL